jgi:hypothetical protein
MWSYLSGICSFKDLEARLLRKLQFACRLPDRLSSLRIST